ncbi:MAG TPA: FkbM family methyltransferase [Thermomicrobiales bacterium]|nr:FkbM family methyltransferase [Thermomicrobiales bacterium]
MASIRSRARRTGILARHNPGLLLELLARRISVRRVPSGTAEGMIGRVRFTFEFDLDPDVRAMWLGRYEVPIVRLLRRYLHPGATFVDVGANIGYISAQAANLVQHAGSVIALEPVLRYHARLERLARANPGFGIHPIRVAAGAAPGHAAIRVSGASNIGYNSMTPGWVPEDKLESVEEVEVRPLDQILSELDVQRLDVLKIDTEGFELPVIEGARESITRFKPVIIVEITPSATINHGRNLHYLADLVRGLGYSSHPIETPARPLDLTTLRHRTDAVLLPVRR